LQKNWRPYGVKILVVFVLVNLRDHSPSDLDVHVHYKTQLFTDAINNVTNC